MQPLKLKAMVPPTIARYFSLLPYAFKIKSFSSSSSSSLVSPWSGLQSWRDSPLNENRFWGPNGPQLLRQELEQSPPPSSTEFAVLGSASSLAELGSVVLSTSDPIAKSWLSHLAFSRWRNEKLPIGTHVLPSRPARPPKPELVSPKEIPAPKDSGLPLNAYMLHNLAHVELNAIDLAWDTVVRFSPFLEILGEGFFADFAHVADDESRHFSWCSQRLAELGFSYGDMPAHSFLWRECEKSSDNVAARLAVIPLVQEARGLDAGPRLVQKLVGCGDNRTSKLVARIAEEEVAHVAVGILKEYNVEVKGPFNYSARDEAGIPRDWYDASFTVEHGENENQSTKGQLSVVYERLASIISLECENAGLHKPAG